MVEAAGTNEARDLAGRLSRLRVRQGAEEERLEPLGLGHRVLGLPSNHRGLRHTQEAGKLGAREPEVRPETPYPQGERHSVIGDLIYHGSPSCMIVLVRHSSHLAGGHESGQ